MFALPKDNEVENYIIYWIVALLEISFYTSMTFGVLVAETAYYWNVTIESTPTAISWASFMILVCLISLSGYNYVY